ncbi:serine hydrolase [Flavobacterium sp. CYK-4]|uniref:serine hydrolase n=1 Tax=Flavobacterium lotistagni TaxID=2709660 RepID=UPI001407507F|nr:serine hydrolase [Flavobacterium lotistagni]NHM07148.1 serine hydrolase [Flavobacterium lotistagni]
MNILNSKKSLGILIFSMIATNCITYYYTTKKNATDTEQTENAATATSDGCMYDIKRMDGFDFIKPILFVDQKCEASNLNSLKQQVGEVVENYKKVGALNSASVYIKEYNTNGWTGINTDEKFMPGSLMKVPELITILKMEELHPGFLNKELLHNKNYVADKHPNYESKSIVLGQRYTVRELLKYMIAYSDNNATALLFENMDTNLFKKVFTDLGLPSPDIKSSNYPISAKEYSYFMRALYNGSYLSNKNSELATEILGQCNFNQGIVSSLPKNTKVSHKFGESGNLSEQQLSESAIVYLDNNPYVITVMTRGKDFKQLPAVLKEISAVTYQYFSQNTSSDGI